MLKKIGGAFSLILVETLLVSTTVFAMESTAVTNTEKETIGSYKTAAIDTNLSLVNSQNKDEITSEIEKVDEQIKQLTNELNEMDSYIDTSTYAMIQSILEIQGLIDGSTGIVVTGGDEIFSGSTPSTSADSTIGRVDNTVTTGGSETVSDILSDVRANSSKISQLDLEVKNKFNSYDDRIKKLEDMVQLNRRNLINFSKGAALEIYTDGTVPLAKGTDGNALLGYDFSNFSSANALSANSKLSEAVQGYLNIPIVNSVTYNKNTSVDTIGNANLQNTYNAVDTVTHQGGTYI